MSTRRRLSELDATGRALLVTKGMMLGGVLLVALSLLGVLLGWWEGFGLVGTVVALLVTVALAAAGLWILRADGPDEVREGQALQRP